MSLPGSSIAERDRQTYHMLARGIPVTTIANALCVSEDTVRRSIKKRREELHGMVNKINQADYAALVMERYDQIIEELWANYETAEKDSAKARYMKLLMDAYGREQKALTDLGLLEVQPEKTEHNIKASVLVSDVDKSELEALTAMVISQRLGKSPEEVIAMSGRGVRPRFKDVYPALPSSEEDAEEEALRIVTPVVGEIELE